MGTKEAIIELRRDGDIFVVAESPELDEADVFDEEWYRHYIDRHCKKAQHTVDILGSQEIKDIFVSRDDEDVAFLLQETEDTETFQLKPRYVNYIEQHVQRFASSETFFEPYRLLVRSQSLEVPIYRTSQE